MLCYYLFTYVLEIIKMFVDNFYHFYENLLLLYDLLCVCVCVFISPKRGSKKVLYLGRIINGSIYHLGGT